MPKLSESLVFNMLVVMPLSVINSWAVVEKVKLRHCWEVAEFILNSKFPSFETVGSEGEPDNKDILASKVSPVPPIGIDVIGLELVSPVKSK